ncbi:MAG: hypothetical protein HZA17_05905 [Nitrospirae bacterium]|nr:hypothetical protein [Nitrospirota bacterium]
MHFELHIRRAILLFAFLFLVTSCATLAGVDEPDGKRPKFPRDTTFPYDQYVIGKPNLDMRVQGGFYIWRIGNLWHVRMAEKLDRPRLPVPVEPVITGSIRVENGITADVRKINIGPLSDVRHKRDDIFFKFDLRDDTFNVDRRRDVESFEVRGDIRGFDFRVQPKGTEYCVRLNMEVDGIPRPGIVHMGSFMHIAETLPLTICVHSFN